jgi:pyruvate dehydrogenase E2 component (dihydrolipoamide acetyltransferase)
MPRGKITPNSEIEHIGATSAPIVNHPEVAILGLGRTRSAPVGEGGPQDFATVPRLRLPLCLAFDHRVVDGAEATRFTHLVVDALGDVEALTLVS